MFGVAKERLVNVLALLQHSRCAYGSSVKEPTQRCDCKYVAKDAETLGRFGSESGSTCPELSMAYAIINSMTDREYERFCKRAGISLT